MHHLRLLGGASIEDAGGPIGGPPAQRHRLALLALLAAAQPSGMARSRLAGLLWPDRPPESGRNLLNQAVHQIRKALGAGVLRSVGDELRLDPDELHCDLLEFREAVETRDLEGAVELYAGPFLDGFRLPDAPGFERWVAGQRTRLEEAQGAALEELARREGERGRWRAAVRLWRRRLELDPHAGRIVLGLMWALDGAGDRAAAIREGEAHARRLREDLEAEPDPEVEALVERLRRSPAEGDGRKTDGPVVAAARAGRGHGDERPGSSSGHSARPSGSPKPDRLETAEPQLVGRREAWERLRDAWRAVSRRGPGLALVSGEAGIGKTRLVAELADWARRRGVLVATARSYPAEGRLAYGPVAGWLRSEAFRATLEGLEDAWRRELAPLLPELADESAEPSDDPPEGWRRQRFFRALVRAALGDGGPRLLVLDDLQWCDPDTLQWLHYLLRFEPTAPLLVVGTVRVEEVRPGHPLTELRLALEREDFGFTEVELGPLDPEAAAELGSEVAGRALGPDEEERLFRETEGHPLFVVEGVRAGMLAGETGDVESERAALPERVRAVLRARLAPLGPDAREVARAAATVGRAFAPEVVRRATGLGWEATAAALDELVERRLVRPSGDVLDFSHDRLREAVLAELEPHRRRFLHRRVAAALEEEHAGDLDAVAGALAAHREAAGEPERALALYRRAARRARRTHGHQEAADYLRRALGLAGELPAADDRAEARRELELQRELGDCLLRTRGWGAPEVEATHVRELELSEVLGDAGDLCRALWGLQSVRMVRADVEEARELGHRLLRRAREQEDPIFVAAGHFVTGFARLLAGELEDAVSELERGIERYRPAAALNPSASFRQDVGLLLLCGASHAAWLLGDGDRARQRERDARSLADRSGTPFARLLVSTYEALLHQYRGDGAAAEDRAGEAVALGEEFGYAHYLHTARVVRGWARAEGGDPGAGLREIRAALEDYRSIGSRIRLPYFLGLEAGVEAELGRREAALRRVEEALELCTATGERWYEAELRRARAGLAERAE